MKILICEDDIYLGNQICRYLQQKGYEIVFCQSVQQVYEKLYEGIDLFLLDVHVHEDTTFDICRLIHNTIQAPVLLLSADLKETSMLMGYDHFAAEYIEKPVTPAVLLAKIRAALKNKSINTIIEKDEYSFDTSNGILKDLEREYLLNQTECLLLAKLLAASPNAVNKEVLKNGVSPDGSDATLRTRISELRHHIPKKLQIQSIRGSGYRMIIGEPE